MHPSLTYELLTRNVFCNTSLIRFTVEQPSFDRSFCNCSCRLLGKGSDGRLQVKPQTLAWTEGKMHRYVMYKVTRNYVVSLLSFSHAD